MREAHQLELRLLGGFEARLGSDAITSFESQKSRALLTYLALHRDKSLDRDFIAGLLWPERSDDSARKNLRQALYNIRTATSSYGDSPEILLREQRGLRLNPDIECWTDVEAFQDAHEAGVGDKGPDPYHLTRAARLYKGDFLAGFFVRDSPAFEEWLVTRQEELREEAIDTFRTLVSLNLGRGEYRYGIRYAKRLLAIDPLSEDAHRQMMRLYVMGGRRARAVAQYEHLMNLLQEELGVSPMEETTELYRSILLAGRNEPEATEDTEAPAPFIPLVGRSSQFVSLQEEWQKVTAGRGRVTWVTGEAGIGKSRLVKTFVDRATSRRETVVLRGSCYGASAKACFRPIADLLGSALNEVIPDEDLNSEVTSSPAIVRLRQVAANAGHLDPIAEEVSYDLETEPKQLAEALLELVDLLCNPRSEATRPMVILLEDLQWADSASLRLIEELSGHVQDRPVWLLLTGTDPLFDASSDEPTSVRISLPRLTSTDVEEIAGALVELASVPLLSGFLHRESEGLPLKVAELINLLWDEGKLHPRSPGAWELRADPVLAVEAQASTAQLIQRRVQTLPTSARRLLAMAAIYGHQFDVEVLQKAADEHLNVVETCIELALERWLIRQFPRSWSPAGLERDIVLWARGARRGYFEFSHDAVREAILEQINPIRRAVMHRDLALALEGHHGDRAIIYCEHLAYHWLAAQEPERALPWLESAAKRANDYGDHDIRDEHLRQAFLILGRLERSDGGELGDLTATRDRLLELQTSDPASSS
jgi:DNA-binding SARP family transcriptional activator